MQHCKQRRGGTGRGSVGGLQPQQLWFVQAAQGKVGRQGGLTWVEIWPPKHLLPWAWPLPSRALSAGPWRGLRPSEWRLVGTGTQVEARRDLRPGSSGRVGVHQGLGAAPAGLDRPRGYGTHTGKQPPQPHRSPSCHPRPSFLLSLSPLPAASLRAAAALHT